MKEIETWPAARTVERTIPQIRFAAGIEPVKLPVGLRHIVAVEATNLKTEVDAAGLTYAEWYQSRFVDRTLAEVAQELNCPLEEFCTSLGLGWNIDGIASEFLLTNVQTDKLLETIGETTVGEMLALALTMGPTKFVAVPLAMLVELVVSSDLVTFYSYLILAQGQLRSLTRWGHLLNSKDQQDYVTQLERMRASLQHWLYSTLVFASGLFVGVDQSQPLHNSERQLPAETAGFPMPQQIADLTLAEVEDFVAVMASVLAPIFGAGGRCVPVSHQTIVESSAGAHGLLLHLSPRTPPTDLSAHRTGCIEWRDAAWVYHLEVGETTGGELDGFVARPHTKSVPFATRVRPSQLVLRASQPEWSPL